MRECKNTAAIVLAAGKGTRMELTFADKKESAQ